MLAVKQGVITLVANTYDQYGRKINSQDCDEGIKMYTYDAWGRLVREMDAKNNVQDYRYNEMHMLTKRIGTEGTTLYQYHGAGSGYANQLYKVTGFNGVDEEYDYDQFGRNVYQKTTLDGKVFETTTSYNNYGNIVSVNYNTGFGYENTYDKNGFLQEVKTKWSGFPYYASESLFLSGSMNGNGQYTSYTLGNGFTTTKTYDHGFPLNTATYGIQNLTTIFNIQTGNLTSRKDYRNNLKEDFTYDNLNRLTSSTVSTFGIVPGFVSPTMSISYDKTATSTQGNIIAKTDVGSYQYSGFPRHAVKYVDNAPGNISKWTQDITYTPFRKTEKVTETDNQSTSNFEQTFTYDASYERVKSVFNQNGGAVQTRYYLGGYEYNVVGNKYIYYVPGGDGLCAIVEHCPSIQAPMKKIHYTYTDNLGSILTVTDDKGVVEAHQNFDAWGRFRNPNDWSYNVYPHPASISSWLYRGYTGHEHMPEFGLINMNGRMYDPLLGRMLAPDIFVHSGTQGHNRFSYAHNNPLSYIDPDGNEPITVAIIIGAAVGAYMGGSMANGTYNPAQWDYSSGKTWSWMAGGAIVGGISAGVGAGIAAGGGVMANTSGIMASSFLNSVGTSIYTGGMTDVSMSFGIGSYNFSNGSLRGIWDWSDLSTMEKVGYTAGALANVQDVVAGLNGVAAEYHAETGDVTHARLTGVDDGETMRHIDISVAHDPAPAGAYKYLGSNTLKSNLDYGRYWATHITEGKYYGLSTGKGLLPLKLNNLNGKWLESMTKNIIFGKGVWGIGRLKYGTSLFGCQSHVAHALWGVGVPTLPINFVPQLLYSQLWLRQMAIYSSGILTNR